MQARRIALCGAAAVLLLSVSAGSARAFLLPDVRVQPGVTYCRHFGEKAPLKLHIFRPWDDAKPRPAVLLIHGGGWMSGSPNGMWPFAWRLAREGYVAVVVQYRLGQRFPEAIHDVKCAVRWLRANSERYNIDSERVAAVGHSAGGHLACMLGMTGPQDGLDGRCGFLWTGRCPGESSRVQCVACWSGVTDLRYWYECCLCDKIKGWENLAAKVALRTFQGGVPMRTGFLWTRPHEGIEAGYRRASPITYASKEAAPTLLIHGTKDALVPFELSERLAKELLYAGATVRFLALDGADHSISGAHERRAEAATIRFLNAQFKHGGK